MSDEWNPLLQAPHEQREVDQQQMLRCQHGEHDLLATASPGMVICRVCLWCGLTLPQGACIVVCAKHIGAVQWQARHPRTARGTAPLGKGETP
jgi:hypothetical protein